MSRPLRIECDGAFRHGMSRGNDRRPIVRDDDDRGAFADVLGESVRRCGARFHAWALMDNHSRRGNSSSRR